MPSSPSATSSVELDTPASTPPVQPEQGRVRGLVPHLWSQKDLRIHRAGELFPKIKVIEVRRHPIEVIKQIASCEFVFSSTLHGLAVADSFQVPNQWVISLCSLSGDGSSGTTTRSSTCRHRTPWSSARSLPAGRTPNAWLRDTGHGRSPRFPDRMDATIHRRAQRQSVEIGLNTSPAGPDHCDSQ
ncbi:polysaccharide pyruvyl transferase family protein [Nocardia terpenica]|nr:polysaccharide pyruvyl transferase family protein [Nocardia terpenica]